MHPTQLAREQAKKDAEEKAKLEEEYRRVQEERQRKERVRREYEERKKQERARLVERRKDRAKERKEMVAMAKAERESWVWEQMYRDQLRLKQLAEDGDSSDSMLPCRCRDLVLVLTCGVLFS